METGVSHHYNEALEADGAVREPHESLMEMMERLGPGMLAKRRAWASERRAARREHGAVSLDLRVDDHPDPVAELRDVYEVGKVEQLPFVDALPTRDKPKVD